MNYGKHLTLSTRMLTYFQLSLALVFLPPFIYKGFAQTAKDVLTLKLLL